MIFTVERATDTDKKWEVEINTLKDLKQYQESLPDVNWIPPAKASLIIDFLDKNGPGITIYDGCIE